MDELIQEIIDDLCNTSMSLSEICKDRGLVYHNIYWRVKRACPDCLSRNSNGSSRTTLIARNNSKKISDDQLITLYNEGLSFSAISEQFDITPGALSQRLKKMGVPARLTNGKWALDSTRIDASELEERYVDDMLSMQEIADAYPHIYRNHGNVQHDLTKADIVPRTYKEAGAALYNKRPEKRDLHRRQFYERVRDGTIFQTITWIERSFADWCTLHDYPYIRNFQFGKYTHRYDYWITGTNILVELDGDYWHSSDWAKERDRRVDEEAADRGYRVYRVRECDISSLPDPFSEIYNELEKIIHAQ